MDKPRTERVIFSDDLQLNVNNRKYKNGKKRSISSFLLIIMMIFFMLVIFIEILFSWTTQTVSLHHTESTSVFTTNQLPTDGSSLDFRILPYIGNGHVATVVYSDFIYMNGLYNGENSTSHRARIPSTLNWRFNVNATVSSYSLDISSGVFKETLETNEIRIERQLFASQEHNELLLAHVVLTRLVPKGNKIHIPVQVSENMTSVDLDLKEESRSDQLVYLIGKTRQIENIQFQSKPLPVFIYYTPLPKDGFNLNEQETKKTYLFVTSIDDQHERAKHSFDYASNKRNPDEILSYHVSRWNDVWLNGHIQVQGDVELQRQINAAFYYILSSLPSMFSRSEHKQFYGLSPGSLSRGGLLGEDYGGHSFWDTETWMYPSVLMFYPTLAKEILSYRIAVRDAAAYNAHLFGYQGWRFPWESARTGIDVTPDCCPEVRLYQMHITGDVAFAARQYVAATGDKNWLLSELGGDLIYEMARFWSSRAIFNAEKNRYEILTVLPPDEDAQPFKNNSVFTNAVASLSIDLANRVSCITKKIVPGQWLNIASNLYFPFDDVAQSHLEYEGFDLNNTTIKQADVILLGFPLMWPMSPDVRRNDLLNYERLTRDDGPAMTWSMHSIGFIELGDFDKAEQLFRRSYETYVRPPFNVWTEARAGVGAVNFITGAGGFLQTVVFGYGGVRLTLDHLEIQPRGILPNNTTKLILHGLKYQGSEFDITIKKKFYEVFLRSQTPNQTVTLEYQHDRDQRTLKLKHRLSFPIDTRLIIRRSTSLCHRSNAMQ